MSLNLPAKTPRVYKPRTDLKSISNESKLKRFMTKNITLTIKDLDLDFDITLFQCEPTYIKGLRISSTIQSRKNNM